MSVQEKRSLEVLRKPLRASQKRKGKRKKYKIMINLIIFARKISRLGQRVCAHS